MKTNLSERLEENEKACWFFRGCSFPWSTGKPRRSDHPSTQRGSLPFSSGRTRGRLFSKGLSVLHVLHKISDIEWLLPERALTQPQRSALLLNCIWGCVGTLGFDLFCISLVFVFLSYTVECFSMATVKDLL